MIYNELPSDNAVKLSAIGFGAAGLKDNAPSRELLERGLEQLALHAGDCTGCGHCDSRCPFGVAQSVRMGEIAEWFAGH